MQVANEAGTIRQYRAVEVVVATNQTRLNLDMATNRIWPNLGVVAAQEMPLASMQQRMLTGLLIEAQTKPGNRALEGGPVTLTAKTRLRSDVLAA